MDLFWEKGDCRIVNTRSVQDELIEFLINRKMLSSSLFLITDNSILDLYAQQLIEFLKQKNIVIHSFILPVGESSKSLENASRCWAHMHQCGIDRQSIVIGIGGGVVTDFSGYIASCFMRGVDLVLIPTTLLAMVDAAIGGKTGVNLPDGKNMIGTFYPAKLVVIFLEYLHTLSEREFRAGLAEVIKYGMACDVLFFEFLEDNFQKITQRDPKIIELIVEKSCKIKVDVVEGDERECNVRAILNWGHTFAHAIETATHYQMFSHGEAVAIGMSCAAYLSHQLGFIPLEVVERQDRMCKMVGLETQLPSVSIERLVDLMARDKKAVAGQISVILARCIGNVFKMDAVDRSMIERALIEKRRAC